MLYKNKSCASSDRSSFSDSNIFKNSLEIIVFWSPDKALDKVLLKLTVSYPDLFSPKVTVRDCKNLLGV